MEDSTTSEIQLFENESFKVRTATDENGNPVFCAKDVATCLGYVNTKDAISKHCKGVAIRYPLQTAGGVQQVRFISEGDLYRLIASSKLESAQKFESWIFDEVVPSIRRHGMYATPQTVEDMLSDPDTMIATLQALKAERAKVAELAPKAGYYDATMSSEGKIPVRDAAKLLKSYDPTMGEKRLRALLRGDGMIEQQTLKATAKAIERGYMVERQCAYTRPDGTTGTKHYGVLTPRGLDWCRARYCNK